MLAMTVAEVGRTEVDNIHKGAAVACVCIAKAMMMIMMSKIS